MLLRLLQYFDCVARKGSISKAAEALNISQPPLTQYIHQLEEELGVQLFVRTNRGVALTETGRDLWEHLQPVLRDIEQWRQYAEALKLGRAGRITIATIASFVPILGDVLRHLSTNAFHIAIQLTECPAKRVAEAVERREAQVGITRLPLATYHLAHEPLVQEPFMAYLASSDTLVRKARLRPSDLEGRPLCIIRSSMEYGPFTRILQCFDEAHIPFRVACYVDNTPQLLQVVAHSGLVGIAPFSGQFLRIPGVVSVPFGDQDIHSTVVLVWSDSLGSSLSTQIRLAIRASDLHAMEGYSHSRTMDSSNTSPHLMHD